jgi:hypothetical protein
MEALFKPYLWGTTMDKPKPEFIGWQEGFGFVAPFPLFNYQAPDMLRGTTVSKETLDKAGVPLPAYPTLEEWIEINRGAK